MKIITYTVIVIVSIIFLAIIWFYTADFDLTYNVDIKGDTKTDKNKFKIIDYEFYIDDIDLSTISMKDLNETGTVKVLVKTTTKITNNTPLSLSLKDIKCDIYYEDVLISRPDDGNNLLVRPHSFGYLRYNFYVILKTQIVDIIDTLVVKKEAALFKYISSFKLFGKTIKVKGDIKYNKR